jgi:tRNA uridine 5-carbamoylmethylation protein Kti12
MYEKLIKALMEKYDFEKSRIAVICVGIPGCGKSTFCKELKKQQLLNVISKDAVRFLFMNYDISNIDFDMQLEDFMAKFVRKQTNWLYYHTPFNFFIDECNETVTKRLAWEKLFAYKNVEIIYVVFDDFEYYKLYMNERKRKVADEIIQQFIKKFTYPQRYILVRNYVK